MIATGPGWELRCGDYREVLADVTCDAVITDPPFSDRTAGGAASTPDWGSRLPLGEQTGVSYGSIGAADTIRMAEQFAPRCPGWWEGALALAGLYTFAPLPYVKTNGAPRFLGDGPASVTEWIVCARPRTHEAAFARRLSRPGYYLATVPKGDGFYGRKDVSVMRALVRDYSRPGDLICDPCAGGGTTLLAAVIEGRRAIGAELDPETFDKAVKRLRRGYTPAMDWEESA